MRNVNATRVTMPNTNKSMFKDEEYPTINIVVKTNRVAITMLRDFE